MAESPSERRRPFGYKIIYHDLGEGRIQDEAVKGGRSPDIQGGDEGDGRGS
jgi:hypothetical protein